MGTSHAKSRPYAISFRDRHAVTRDVGVAGPRSRSTSIGGTISVLTIQQRIIPAAAMKPKSRKARKSVTSSDAYDAAEASAAMAVGFHVACTAVRIAVVGSRPRRRSSK